MAAYCESLRKQNQVLLRTLDHVHGDAAPVDLDFVEPHGPLQTSAEVIELNAKLIEPSFRDQVFRRLKQWKIPSRGNHRKNVRKCMERMIGYEAFIQFSWTGKTSIDDQNNIRTPRKLQFTEMNEIIQMIMDLFKKAHADTEAEIKYFMKRVPQTYRAKISR